MVLKHKLRGKVFVEDGGNLLYLNPKNFKLSHIFECGQAFHFNGIDENIYVTVGENDFLIIEEKNDKVIFKDINLEKFKNIWWNYFDLSRDYDEIKENISKDEVMKKAIEFGYGIRVLNQPIFECLMSFIISANNQIPRIKKSIKLISEKYGKYLGNAFGEKLYSFPKPKAFLTVTPKDLRDNCSVGFRDERIVETAIKIHNDFSKLYKLKSKSYEELKKILMQFKGVGPKVADCVLLFAFEKSESFPVDVWIKRVMENLYFNEEVPIKETAERARKIFGKYSGFAQQYLFYYGREHKIGVK